MDDKMYATKSTEKQSRLCNALDRLRSCNGMLTDVRERLYGIHRKAAGPEVEEEMPGDAKAMPTGTISTMEDLLNDIERKIGQISVTLNKLEQTF